MYTTSTTKIKSRMDGCSHLSIPVQTREIESKETKIKGEHKEEHRSNNIIIIRGRW